ncbi:GNAT family N-acetyltransferase [Maritalea mediterranea]|uniref:GNAT family N-acetyltransferase n=1 Tax=Maritalea mediterranea TaxID=2909667 RepID=A0ABS9ECU4_9HYPH|nr:GNAT family N-acetyltransferase [Maritalea mediterranea]MCF4099999.1 GNAT family N-acetyltransferase [Maritalea mediterranea]
MVQIRKASEKDLPRLVEIFRVSRQELLPFLPILHTREQDFAHLKDLWGRGEIFVGILADQIAGFLVQIDHWIAHLYVHPTAIERGVGKALLDHAKGRAVKLELWCFEDNMRARAFYEAQGFECVRKTDGDNEEGLPDRLYRWHRARY